MAVRLPQDTTLVENVLSRGIVRDVPRHQIQAGAVYDAVDFLFDRPGGIYKRGGSAFQSSALPSQALVVAVAAPEFPGDPRVVAIGTDGASTRKLFDVTTGTAATGVDVNGAQPTENPPLYVDKLIITDGLGNGSGTYAVVQKASITASVVVVGNLGGTPPNARCSCVHNSYLVLANTVANPNRLFFSPIPDIETAWDTTNAYIDVPTAITGLASVQGVLIVFTRGRTWRVIGNIPPGTTGENMQLQPIGGIGCIDARSIVTMNGLVYFADESGVYYTNGAGYESITLKDDDSGISSLWAEAVAGYSPSLGSVVCAGVWLNQHLFITVRHASSDPQAGARYQFLWHASSQAWTRLSDGVTATMYATRFAPHGELYAGCGDTGDSVRVLALSGLFDPTSSNTTDANGGAVEPTITYRPFAAGFGLKAFGHGHVTYDMRGSGAPTLAVATAPGLEAPTFTTRATLAATTESERRRFDASKDSQALSVRLAQTGASTSTELFAVEMEARPYDQPSEVA